MAKKDYYQVLGVNRQSNEQEIKKAFRKLAMQYHPDRNKDPDAENRFKEIGEAYEVLSNPSKRKMYDLYGHEGVNQGAASGQQYSANFSDFSEFFSSEGDTGGSFSDFFQNIFSGQHRSKNAFAPQKGSDKLAQISITFEESVVGKTIHQKLELYQICSSCKGSGALSERHIRNCLTCKGMGKVVRTTRTFLGHTSIESVCPECRGQGRIITSSCAACKGQKYEKAIKDVEIKTPGGINHGQTIRLKGFGHPGQNGGESGDLIIRVVIAPHSFYTRVGNNVHLEAPLSFHMLLLEEEIEIPTPYGRVKHKLKNSYAPSETIVIPRRGFPQRGGYVGDLVLTLKIYVPANALKKRSSISDFAKLKDKEYRDWLKNFPK